MPGPASFSIWMLLIGMLSLAPTANAQNDSTYYHAYPQRITGRLYFSNKYTMVQFRNSRDNYKLRYQPNTTINIGVGATYRWATLNLGIGFLNRDPAKGKTRYLDLQFHNYGRKFVVDLLGEFYRGFYLYPKGTGGAPNSFYTRPDLFVNEIGGVFQYVFNHNRFSYRAAFLQNEWQRKSAGSFLIGIEVYSGNIVADSTIVPALINRDVARQNIRRIHFFEAGPNVGYAYTLVIKKHYFLMSSAAISLDYGTNTIESNEPEITTNGFSLNRIFRVCAGYNSQTWALSFVYLNNGVQGTSSSSDRQLALSTGNFRINYVRRFILRNKAKQVLKAL